MVNVYIWNFKGKREAWGHAAMEVNNEYISWWPRTANKKESKAGDDVYSVRAIMNRKFSDDKRDEAAFPTHVISIRGLDEKKIVAWWRGNAHTFGGIAQQGPRTVPWSSMGWNSSRVIATALKAGGADNIVSDKRGKKVRWSPNDVRRFAIGIVVNLAKKKDAKSKNSVKG